MSDLQQDVANNPISLASVSSLTSNLRTYARSQLPEAMVPSRFIILDKLPKLPNGKVDRQRLPAVDIDDSDNENYVPPTNPDEIKIARIWQDILGINRVGIEDSFFDLGGDSITVVQMAAKVREEYNIELSLRRLFKNPTITALVQMISAEGIIVTGSGLINLNDEELIEEAQLPDDIFPDKDALAPVSNNYKTILLTGGTGYTGAFLLRELLDRSDAYIYVLARAKDPVDAVNRVIENLKYYALLKDKDESRLRGVAGDIGRPYFALTKNEYEEIATEVEMVVHNAALSSYAMPYKQLKPINVLGTHEVLRLACRKRIKPIHYISSLSVFPGHKGTQYFSETKLTEPDGLVGGYRQTKWVSDRLVSLIRTRGVPTCIYRPGQITGAQDTGACSTDTYLNSAIKSCIQLGAELDFDVMLEITPVDFCAKAVAHIALSGDKLNNQYHMVGNRTVSWEEVCEMIRGHGYKLRNISYPDWYKELSTALKNGKENALSKFFPLFGEQSASADAGDEGSHPEFETKNLVNALEGSGIECRELDQEFLSLYINYFISIGFIPSPEQQIENGG